MKLSKSNLNIYSALIIVILMPFSYLSIYGVRVLPLFLILAYSLLVFNIKRITINYGFIFYLFIFIIVFLMAIYINKYESLLSVIIFFLITYWPLFINNIKSANEVFFKIINIYIYGGVFMGFGVIAQYYLYNNHGIEIGRVSEYAERIGYSFIWNDFSFISLYFCSIIPLIWYRKNNGVFNLLISFFMIFSSIFTTARTGIYALFIFGFFLIIFKFLKFLTFRKMVNLRKLFSGIFVIFFVVFNFIFFYNENSNSRIFSIDSSGRIDDYLVAINYFNENFIFGSFYNNDLYKLETNTIIPHNLFLYNLVLGGGVFFLFFILWFFSTLKNALAVRSELIFYSFIICVIGFQFIPAVFTAYFFAFIISLILFRIKFGSF